MALNKPVSAVPQVVNAFPAETYLGLYLRHLSTNPLRTKAITSGALSALQEFLASYIAGEKSPDGTYFTNRVPKMAFYGAVISAPLGHVLTLVLQKVFEGKTTVKDKILQILFSNLLIAPIQNGVYLASMAVIAGAKNFEQIKATVKVGFLPVMKISWMVSPVTLLFAQKYLPPQAWVPFFNLVGFVLGTYINTQTKRRRRLAALKKQAEEEKRL